MTAKRFYKEVTPVADREEGHGVLLDGRMLRTPQKNPLRLPTAELAAAIVAEWQAQGETIDPQAMPMTRRANAAIDYVALWHDAVVAEILRFGETDTLCYRAEQPAELRARQDAAWQPLLDWAAERFGADFRVAQGVLPVAQPEESLALLWPVVGQLDAYALTGLHGIVSEVGSLVLGCAVLEERIDAVTVWRFSQIEEDFQNQQWGADEEAQARQAYRRQELLDAALFLRLAQAAD